MPDSIVDGTLELCPQGHGFLRSASLGYAARQTDPLVPQDLVRRFVLRGGEHLVGRVRRGDGSRSGPRSLFSLADIQTISGLDPEACAERPPFHELTPIDPTHRLQFETPAGPLSMRVVDLMTPIGMGQRGLIAAPPRTGKTVLLQQMSAGITANHPDLYMMVLLIDERPEEVTEMRRTVHGEVVASCNDRDVASHVRIARLMIEKAKRMVEAGRDVLILLDSLTRLGRAFNAAARYSGRIMSGGIDAGALNEPKAIFGAARNIEHGGSLTILASAIIETGSRMDEVIFNEFKGTGNMEIVLSRDLANLRLWPAIDLNQSGTRKEDLLLGAAVVQKVYRIRRQIASLPPPKAMQTLLDSLSKYPGNAEFLASLAS